MSEIISLEDILKQLYAISGILIDVYDLEGHSVARYPDTGAYFCSLVTRNSQGCERCGRDNREAFATVREEHKVHIYRCHMGLYEAVFPLYHYGRLAGYMMTGQMLEKREGAAEEVMQKARQMNLGSEEEIAEGVKKLVRMRVWKRSGAFDDHVQGSVRTMIRPTIISSRSLPLERPKRSSAIWKSITGRTLLWKGCAAGSGTARQG